MRDEMEGRVGEPLQLERIPTEIHPPPFLYGDFYFAEVAAGIYLQLRYEPIPAPVPDHFDIAPLVAPNENIALLMTDEHPNTTVETLGTLMYEQLRSQEIQFSTVISPVALGPVLGREITKAVQREEGRAVPALSIQKGKFLEMSSEQIAQLGGGFVWIPEELTSATPERIREYLETARRMGMGPPKPWVHGENCVSTASGTSKEGSTQLLSLDPKVAGYMRWTAEKTGFGTVIVDDAYLFGGTVQSSLELLSRAGIPVAGVITVLNEGPNEGVVLNSVGDRIPRMWLAKLPMLAQVQDDQGQHARMPIPGTFDGLEYFYRRIL